MVSMARGRFWLEGGGVPTPIRFVPSFADGVGLPCDEADDTTDGLLLHTPMIIAAH